MKFTKGTWGKSINFTIGGILNNENERCEGYVWRGSFPKHVPPGSSVFTTGGLGKNEWIDTIPGCRNEA